MHHVIPVSGLSSKIPSAEWLPMFYNVVAIIKYAMLGGLPQLPDKLEVFLHMLTRPVSVGAVW